MRKVLMFVPLLLSTTPAMAQEARLPPELTDPQSAMKFGFRLQALSDALLNVRVGDIGAALEGRPATARERNLTVRDVVHRNDPNFEQHMQQTVATVGPKVVRSMQAVNRAIPEVMRDVDDAQRSFDRAIANLPDPTYPRR
jgi:hypothetical protein